MEKNSINLDEKINLIYNFLNNQVDDSCIKIENIDLKNIGIDDIKIGIEYNDITKDIFKYILDGNIQLIDKNEDELIIKRLSDNFNFDIHITTYSKNQKIDNILSNRDSLFSYILSKLILDKKTSHILLPILNFDIRMKHLESILKPLDFFLHYDDLINLDKISDIFSMKLRENFTKSNNLKKYLNEEDINIKHLLFQIIHTLAVIQKDFPTFTHNNLKLKNIMVNQILEEDKKYIFDNQLYELQNLNFSIKIFNFKDSEMKDFKNPDIKNKNKFSDLYTFIDDLYQHTKFKNVDSETKTFIDKIYNKKTKGKESFLPKNLLDENYFKSLKISKNKSNEKKSSKTNYMNNENVFMTNLESESRSVLGNQTETENKFKRNEVKNLKKSSKKLSRKLKVEQEGGNRQFKSPFNKVKNNPFVSNDEKDTFIKRKNEEPPKKEPLLLAEQKVYDRPSKKSEVVLPQTYPPAYVPVPNPYYPNMNPQYAYGYKPNQIPVQKHYNITLSNPVGNHTTINEVYEDMLPGDDREYTLASVFERKQLTNFFRSLILENGDGDEISISPGESKTLLSYIRLLELNPFNIDRNPYESLSKGFLLYNAAYPLRYNQEKNDLNIAKRALGVNVRIYQMSEGAMRANRLTDEIDYSNFEVWRDIRYYEYVREEILKRKVCPNFVGLYLYTLDKNSRIDYSKIDMVKYKNQPKNSLSNEVKNIKKINDLHNIDPLELFLFDSYNMQYKKVDGDVLLTNNAVNDKYLKNIAIYLVKNNYILLTPGTKKEYKWTDEGIKYLVSYKFYNLVEEENRPRTGTLVTTQQIRLLANLVGKQDLTKSSNNSLIALTEAPNKNILQWASPLVDNYGAIKRMIQTGYHTPNVWKSVLFQMVFACAVLQKSGIYFENFSLENNFYVKDLYVDESKKGHWIYKSKDFTFYVPNYGYLLMFDSRFVDLYDDYNLIGKKEDEEQKFKINSLNLYPKNNIKNKGLYKGLIYSDFKSLINPDNFRKNLEKVGGEHPDQEILDLLQKIYDDTGLNQNIDEFLPKYFPFFFNNRIGSFLTKDEMDMLPIIPNYNFIEGDLAAYQVSYNQYKWVVIVKMLPGSMIEIQDSKDSGLTTNVAIWQLNKYPETETVKQKTVDNINFDSNFTIETYNIDN